MSDEERKWKACVPGQINATDIETALQRVTEQIMKSTTKPDLIFSNCKKCGQAVASAFYPVEMCPMCSPEEFKK